MTRARQGQYFCDISHAVNVTSNTNESGASVDMAGWGNFAFCMTYVAGSATLFTLMIQDSDDGIAFTAAKEITGIDATVANATYWITEEAKNLRRYVRGRIVRDSGNWSGGAVNMRYNPIAQGVPANDNPPQGPLVDA